MGSAAEVEEIGVVLGKIHVGREKRISVLGHTGKCRWEEQRASEIGVRRLNI